MKTKVFASIVLLLCMAVVASSEIDNSRAGDPAKSSAAHEINIDNFSFTPAILTVPAGATVTWTNHDDIPHNIVSSEQKFKSKPLDTDDAYALTFTEPGTYQYFCGLHPKMVGKVIVRERK